MDAPGARTDGREEAGRPAEILQRLIRFDTSNPPGGERECIDWVSSLLEGLDCEVRILARDPERPNLIARLRGPRRRRRPCCCRATWTSSRPGASGHTSRSRARSTTASSGAAAHWT